MRKKIPVSDKLSAAFSVLVEKGPLSISSLAEEVSRLINSKVTTIRAQISVVLPSLIHYKLVEEVGSDRFGSRLIDITPKTISILLASLASGLEYKFLTWDSIIKYFERKTEFKHLVKKVNLLKCVVEAWKLKVFGNAYEEKEYSDILEDITEALLVLGRRRLAEKEIVEGLNNIITDKILECIEENCMDLAIENARKLELIEELREIMKHIEKGKEKELEEIRKLLRKL